MHINKLDRKLHTFKNKYIIQHPKVLNMLIPVLIRVTV